MSAHSFKSAGPESILDVSLENASDLFAAQSRSTLQLIFASDKSYRNLVKCCRPDAGDNPDIVILQMNLTSFSSIRAFASKVIAEHKRVDCLILNAAVMQTPQW